ncbi:hypothetical protein Pryu01_02590 [Paraliobacillus ryukyuensis]|uniref:Glycopeptide antibiotics resistance protein n=1 Tax=Paraliobacillus ryukyuensis TaxID=200904 RepID=A0A366ECF4_9BACI|nr:VanZ family protein [Paraliobacillus ryukyuensis]RBO99745.1 glycopeptide antibiotics resistance protein [Paraliobacillus ryukyuensis]
MIHLNPIIIYSMLTLLWVWYRGHRYLQRKRYFHFLREFILNAFFVYLLAVSYVTMEPFYFTNEIAIDGAIRFDTHLFYNLLHMAEGYIVLKLLYTVGNILLFVPLGMFIPYLFKHTNHFLVILLLGFFSSLTIELIQMFFTPTRLATVDDLFFNTTGAIIGYLLFVILRTSYYKTIQLVRKSTRV